MRDLMAGDGTVGFILPSTIDGPFTVKEWDTDGRLIRVQTRVLKPGERDPFSSDETADEDERERLFWERTEKVSDTLPPRGSAPTWVRYAFFVSMCLNPAVWVTVAWKMYRERKRT